VDLETLSTPLFNQTLDGEPIPTKRNYESLQPPEPAISKRPTCWQTACGFAKPRQLQALKTR